MTTSNSISVCMYRCCDCEHVFAVRSSSKDKQISNRFTLYHHKARPTCEKCGSVDVKRLGEKSIILPEKRP